MKLRPGAVARPRSYGACLGRAYFRYGIVARQPDASTKAVSNLGVISTTPFRPPPRSRGPSRERDAFRASAPFCSLFYLYVIGARYTYTRSILHTQNLREEPAGPNEQHGARRQIGSVQRLARSPEDPRRERGTQLIRGARVDHAAGVPGRSNGSQSKAVGWKPAALGRHQSAAVASLRHPRGKGCGLSSYAQGAAFSK